MPKEKNEKARYPYLSFQTFMSLISKMEKEGIPARIDRGYLQYTSGTNQIYLPMALRSFDLLNDDNTATEDLTALVKKPGERKELLGNLIRKHYAKQLALPENATAQMLEETFTPLQGETRRKAITFFLHGATEAGIPLSKHFKAPKQVRGGPRPGSTRRRSTRGARSKDEEQTPAPPDGSRGGLMDHKITLRSGGELTVSLSEDANIFTLSEEDEEFVMGFVRRLREYSKRSPSPRKPRKQAEKSGEESKVDSEAFVDESEGQEQDEEQE